MTLPWDYARCPGVVGCPICDSCERRPDKSKPSRGGYSTWLLGVPRQNLVDGKWTCIDRIAVKGAKA